MSWLLYLLSGFLLANGLGQPPSCDPDRVASLSILWEACQQKRVHCDILLAYANQEGRTHASIVDVTLIPDSQRSANDHGILLPGHFINATVDRQNTTTLRSYGLIRFYDSGRIYRSGDFREHYIFRNLDGEISIIPAAQVTRLQRPSESTQMAAQLTELIKAAGMGRGTQLMIAGREYVLAEVQGKIMDESAEYVFLKRGQEVIRYPVEKFIQATAPFFPPQAVAKARAIKQVGGRLATYLMKSPLAGVLEMSLSPTMAACSDTASRFVSNICSREPTRFTSWFLHLSSFDRAEILRDPTYCQILSGIIDQEVQKVKQERDQTLARYQSLWQPRNLHCGSVTSFEMDRNTLGQSPSSENEYFLYHFEAICPVGSIDCGRFRLSVEPRSRSRKTRMGPTQVYQFDDPGSRIVGTGVFKNQPHGPATTEATNVNHDLQVWLLDQVSRRCWNEKIGGSGLEVPLDQHHRVSN